jgi:HSP20 family protein
LHEYQIADPVSAFPGNRTLAQRPKDAHPIPMLRREIDQLFEDFFRDFGFSGMVDRMPTMVAPRLDVSETEQEVQIVAEMPGINEKDIEVTLADDVLTIRGEKTAESDQKKRNYHLMERSQGMFMRSLRLPFTVDANQVKALFKDGVLTIAIPKPKEAQEKVKKIAVTRDGDSTRTQQPQAAAAE